MPEITNVGLNIAEKSTVIWNVADIMLVLMEEDTAYTMREK